MDSKERTMALSPKTEVNATKGKDSGVSWVFKEHKVYYMAIGLGLLDDKAWKVQESDHLRDVYTKFTL